jgi:hypothetical protein
MIITAKWIFASVLSGPYTNCANGNPVYLDGFSFTGLVSLQTVYSKWPATAGLEDNNPTILEAFDRSTFIQPVVEAQEELENGGEDDAEAGNSSAKGGASEN